MTGGMSCLPNHGRNEAEHDYEMSAYWRTYDDVRRTESESAYSSVNEMNGTNENPPAMRRRTRSPPSLNDGYDDPSPCAALCV